MNLKIFNFYFNKSVINKNEKYLIPIQCGKEISNIDLNIECDNTGDNISIKNPYYSELTGIYWIWKNYNINNISHIGTCHYRRKFDTKYLEKIIKKVPNFDIIMPQKIKLGSCWSIESHYYLMHIKEDFDIMKNYMKKNFPNYDLSILEKSKIPYINNKMYTYNMFIMKNEIFFDYCNWIFKILFDLEKEIKPSEYPYQKRVYGYLAERLLNVYINEMKKQGKKIIDCKVNLS